MRYFIEDFERLYNKENPFGFFPDWGHYKSTGTKGNEGNGEGNGDSHH